MSVEVKIIKQLKDNYSYIIYSKETNEALIIDPSEPKPILNFLELNKLVLKGVLATHHHSDHTQGIREIKNKYKIDVYSPNENIEDTTVILKDNQKIDFKFISLKIISTPGHTLDHIVYYCDKENLLFSGDTLFYYGCGRVFEGTYEQMLQSLNKLKSLPDNTKVYCGHEYTYKNLEFVLDELVYWQDKGAVKQKTREMIEKRGSSMPFDLGHQKEWNPFLNCDDPHYKKSIADFEGKINKDASELDFFTFIREKRNKF